MIQTVEDMAVLCNPCRGVEAEDACVVLEGGPCLPCKERAAISDQIKQLKAKYDTIGTARNAIHDPFIHKFPPEIASHIFRLSLPTLKNGEDDPKGVHGQWSIRKEWAVPLKLGSVCRKWRELAWATPDLWTTLYIRIKPSMTPSTAESLPGLLREWLGRSGVLPLTIYFFPYDNHSDFVSEDEYLEEFTDCTESLDVTAGLVIDLLNLHSGRWRNLHLRTSPAILERFSCSTEPKQLIGLELADTTNEINPSPKFIVEWELNLTHLKLVSFLPTLINIRWDNITHATLSAVTDEEVVDFLRQATSLEYYSALTYSDEPMISIQTPILHPQLRSLNLTTYNLKNLMDAINLPSLEEWTQNTCRENLPLAAMLSFLERSQCPLKVLNLDAGPGRSADFRSLLQALPSLEHLFLRLRGKFESTTVMDDILTRIFRSVPGSSDILVNTPLESFLPNLQFMECWADWTHAPFSWDRIPQLYLQGHRQSLTLKCAASSLDISDETALRLLQLVDEGFDLEIPEEIRNGDFLENFRNRIREEIL